MALTLIKQRGETDCGVAAIAMLLEKTYEEVWSALPSDTQERILKQGMVDETFQACIERFGFVYEKDFTKRVYMPYWGSVKACLNLLWGRRAIVSVWSKNYPESGHFIVFDGTDGEETVLDPSPKQVYDDWRDTEPKTMWLFSENAFKSTNVYAKRYLWLRDNGRAHSKKSGVTINKNKMEALLVFRYWCEPDTMDEAIDDAMSNQVPT